MAETRIYPHGVTSWIDAQFGDVDAALEFYAGLFGWHFTEVTPAGLPFRYLIATLDGADVAGIGGPSTPAAPGSGGSAWDTYIAVDDAAATAQAATAAGGRVITEPEVVGEAGTSAQVEDPQGARIHLWQAKNRLGAQITNVPGAWNFSDLHTSDTAAATAFYSEVFGWQITDMGFATMITVGGYGDHLAATVDPDIHERQKTAPPGFADSIGWLSQAADGQAPNWHVTFAVADRDATVATAERLGAVIVSTDADDWTHSAVIRDPQGAVFTASQFTPTEEW